MRAEVETLQDLFRIALILLEMQRRAETVGAEDVGMIRKRQFHHSDETGETALARRHFLAQHAGMAGAKQEHQPALGDGGGAYFRRLLDGRQLMLPNLAQEFGRLFEVRYRGIHEDLRIAESRRAIQRSDGVAARG